MTARFQVFETVEAIAWGGSQTATGSDQLSDIDLYVYTSTTIPLAARQALVAELGAAQADLNLQFWDPGDEWFDATTGIEVDVMYWEPAWIEAQLDRVWRQAQASLGYTTCFWHTVKNSRVLFDRRGWFTELHQRSNQAYPEALRCAIVAKNHAVLRRVIPSYAHQIEKAHRRHDGVSLNHRVAALLASYFDVIFALNRVLHPGEKRLIDLAQAQCAHLPVAMTEQLTGLLRATGAPDDSLLPQVNGLLDNLDELLRREGFDPATSLPIV